MCMFEAIEENPEDYQKNLQTYFQAATLFSLIWGVAGILDTGSRDKFDAFLRKVSEVIVEDRKNSILLITIRI